ncbi:hypothetical protein Tco_0147925 [Tanacetum coccineum]
MSVPVTAKEKTNKKNDVKARSCCYSWLFPMNIHVSRLAILGVVIAQENLNSKFLNSLPPKWNTHVKSVGASSGAQNLAFMTAPSTSSTIDVNTTIPAYEVSTASPNINTATPQVSTASFSDNVVYAFMVENPNGSNLLQ